MRKKMCWFSWLYRPMPTAAIARCLGASLTVAILIAVPNMAKAQNNAPGDSATPVTQLSAPAGYSLHGKINMGGHMAGITGSDAMYATLVNLHSGPRILGDSFELRPLKSNKHPLFDHMQVFSNGFGGDPFNFTRMDVVKGKYYTFTGTFRRDRRYFDYDLLANPNIPSGQSIPIGPTSEPTGHLAWPQVLQSPFLYNTVRRMTDASLTLLPVSRVTYHFEYAQNVFEGPSLSPGAGSPYFAPSLGAASQLLEAHQRNSVDEFIGSINWKPVRGTKLTFEEVVDHTKIDTYYTIAPSQYYLQEADGTPVSIGSWDSLSPYSIRSCSTGDSILSDPQTPGGMPIINPTCNVAVSYLRSQPTRFIFPTEIFRFQTESIKNVSMNGDIRYTAANMTLPHYLEKFEGLSGRTRYLTYTGNAHANRKVIAVDYGLVWQASPAWSLSEELTYSDVRQPGVAKISTGSALLTPTTDETITYSGPLTPSTASAGEGAADGTPNFFGQKRFNNQVTATWSGLSHLTLSLGYRYHQQIIALGNPHNTPLPVGSTTNGTVTIHQNGGIFTADFRPTAQWNVNGRVAIFYSDNAYTPVSPRQMNRYRVHAIFHPKSWLRLNAAYNDLEIHNNTNNNQAAVAADEATYAGPIEHVAYSRIIGVGASIVPNPHYAFDLNYGYSDIYSSTNICYNADPSPEYPGAATQSGTACPGGTVRGETYLEFGPTKDFEHAPTQYGTVTLDLHPYKRLRSSLGYNISSVDGSRFYNDARDVAGSLVSTYQSPFAKVSWTVVNGLVWEAEYNYYGYGEGGPSGAAYCATSGAYPGNPAPVVPCDSPSLIGTQTGLTISPAGETAPRNFHANIVTLGMHYEF